MCMYRCIHWMCIYIICLMHTHRFPLASESGVFMKARVTPLCFYGKPT